MDTKMKILFEKKYFEYDYSSFGKDFVNSHKNAFVIKEISNKYYKQIDNDIFVHFLKQVGTIHKIKIDETSIWSNKDKIRLKQDYRYNTKLTKTQINEDWTINRIVKLLKYRSFDVSLLIWNAVKSAHKEVLVAKFRPNQQYPIREARSQLIQHLESSAWIPDIYGKFHSPKDMSREMLPKEFVYDDRNGWLTAIGFGQNIRKSQKEYQETNKILKEKTGFALDSLESARKAGVTDDDIRRLAKEKEQQRLKDSLGVNQSNGDGQEFVRSENNEDIIIDEEQHQKNIHQENKHNTNTFTNRQTSYKTQDTQALKKIEDFLYEEYEGHCQICGDTFADNGKNVFKTKSLNRGKNRDVNRKGNSLSLCHKHHEILKRKLQENTFLEKLNDSLDLEIIKKNFRFEDFVSKEDDGFYRLNEDDEFARDDVYFFPIKLFGKTEYIKFTEAHIMEFIEVWNNN